MSLDLLDRKGKYSNGFCHWPQPAWVKADGSWQPTVTHFTSLADPAASPPRLASRAPDEPIPLRLCPGAPLTRLGGPVPVRSRLRAHRADDADARGGPRRALRQHPHALAAL